MEELILTYLLLKVDYGTFSYGLFKIHVTFSFLLASLYTSKVLVQSRCIEQSFCKYSMIQAFSNWAEITKSQNKFRQ